MEHDDTGWTTAAFVLAIAATSKEAKQMMIHAIDARAATASLQDRKRLYAIFVEAPRELPADDPHKDLITDPFVPVFPGLTEQRATLCRYLERPPPGSCQGRRIFGGCPDRRGTSAAVLTG